MRFAEENRSPLCPCQLGGYGQEGEGAGVTTTAAASSGLGAARSVGLGVLTGVLVWAVTNFLSQRTSRRRRSRR